MNDIHRQVGDLTEFTPGNDTARAQLDAEIERLREGLDLIKRYSDGNSIVWTLAYEALHNQPYSASHTSNEGQCPAGGTHESDHYICTKCGLKTGVLGSALNGKGGQSC